MILQNDLSTVSFPSFSPNFPLIPLTIIALTILLTDLIGTFAELIFLEVIVKSLLSMSHFARPTVLVYFIHFDRLLDSVFLFFFFFASICYAYLTINHYSSCVES